MIISASRRTDIPAFYSDWFFNRLKAGFALNRNPVNARQISRIRLTPDAVDCIVFWTKNAGPMMHRHWDELKAMEIPFYFQYTVNPYGRVLEPNLPPQEEIVKSFIRLSAEFGRTRVVWRYDPVIFSGKFTEEYHCREFGLLAEKIAPYTDECVISFLDEYRKTQQNMPQNSYIIAGRAQQISLGRKLAAIAGKHGLTLSACGEPDYLDEIGIRRAKCIDPDRVERICGRPFIGCRQDTLKRSVRGTFIQCGCAPCVEIGENHTCLHGCKYCYATQNEKTARKNHASHDPRSPLLTGRMEDLTEADRITDRKTFSVLGPE